uniref:Uncharacterized protein n=1 Tax=Virus NIOZ-UU157 TaxID=2763269 RepID=A0A7S9STY4_9VIRU|nr:MAG: hypothetical protein NIOZUU157_00180 [Virus NIOZ-UU157]
MLCVFVSKIYLWTIALSVSIGACPVISKATYNKGLINSSKNQLGLISNSLMEFIAVKSCASVGSLAKTNFLNVPSDNLIELLPSLKLVIVLILVFNLSTEFLR